MFLFEFQVEVFPNGDWNNGVTITLTAEECAQPVDLSLIVVPKLGLTSECSLYTFYGTPIRTCEDAMQRSANSDTVTFKDIFVVPAGRFFMLPAKRVGDKLYLTHVGEWNCVLSLPFRSWTCYCSAASTALSTFLFHCIQHCAWR